MIRYRWVFTNRLLWRLRQPIPADRAENSHNCPYDETEGREEPDDSPVTSAPDTPVPVPILAVENPPVFWPSVLFVTVARQVVIHYGLEAVDEGFFFDAVEFAGLLSDRAVADLPLADELGFDPV